MTVCVHCGKPIEQDLFMGDRTWAHPDRYDVDEHGIECADGEHEAEPAT